MSEVRSTSIIPISVYCFLLSFFFLSVAADSIFSNITVLSSADLGLWLPVGASLIFACGLTYVGIGIINVDQLCWKILFFCLAICVACIASLIIAFVIFFFLNAKFIYSFVQTSHISPVTWFCSLSFFLSEIIVLYYLASNDVVSCFGEMGDMLTPF